jgi:anthranilate/para-aminobenzoate synthase component I
MFMFVNSFIAFDHATQKMRIVALCSLEGDVVKNYALSVARIEELRSRLAQPAVQFVDADPTRYASRVRMRVRLCCVLLCVCVCVCCVACA